MFPGALVDAISSHLQAHYLNSGSPIHILRRPLRPSDQSRSVAVRAGGWRQTGREIGRYEPLESIHSIEIQSLVKHALEETAAGEHNILTNELRMLAQQEELMTALGQMTCEFGGFIERPMKLRVISQDFFENSVPGNFLFSSFTVIEITTTSER